MLALRSAAARHSALQEEMLTNHTPRALYSHWVLAYV